MNGPVDILRQLDEDLMMYVSLIKDHYLFIVFIVPVIEEYFRYACVNVMQDTQCISQEFHEPILIADRAVSYYDGYLFYLSVAEGWTMSEIKKTCGSKVGDVTYAQVLEKLRKAFDLPN